MIKYGPTLFFASTPLSGARSELLGVLKGRERKLARQARPWTNLHRREALRALLRTLEVYAGGLDLERAEREEEAGYRLRAEDVASEAAYRAALIDQGLGLSRDTVDAIVRDVRDLAEGRKVREEVYRVVCHNVMMAPRIIYEGAERPTKAQRVGPCTVVHVSRIRRVASAGTSAGREVASR